MIYTAKPEDFEAAIWDPRYDVLDIMHITEHVDRIVRRLRPERTQSPKTNNLVVASFVILMRDFASTILWSKLKLIQNTADFYIRTRTLSFMPEKKA